MKAIILAAGKGNRLRPHTDHVPKPLLTLKENGDETLLGYILNHLPSYIDEVIIITKHLGHMIDDFVKDHAAAISASNPNIKSIITVEQTGPKGTMGALQSVRHLLVGTFGEPYSKFLVLNGDDVHNLEDLESFNKYPRGFGVQKKIMPGYLSTQIGEDGIITKLQAQTAEETMHGCLIATGVYLIDEKVFEFEPVILNDGEIGLPQTLIANMSNYPMHAIIESGWLSVNSLDDLDTLRQKFS